MKLHFRVEAEALPRQPHLGTACENVSGGEDDGGGDGGNRE